MWIVGVIRIRPIRRIIHKGPFLYKRLLMHTKSYMDMTIERKENNKLINTSPIIKTELHMPDHEIICSSAPAHVLAMLEMLASTRDFLTLPSFIHRYYGLLHDFYKLPFLAQDR